MYQQLRDYAWNYLTRKERLEEVLQDTFWSIYVNMEIVMKEENYYSWIFECFKNNLKEAIQKEIVFLDDKSSSYIDLLSYLKFLSFLQ